MARISRKKVVQSNYTILLVDDDLDYLAPTGRLLEREGHQVFTCDNGPAALDILRDRKIDLLLLDYFMPGMTGEEVVAELRKFNTVVQVILQTGYASEQPPRELLRRLDIQGYFDKSEGPDKLLLWVEVGIKAAFRVQLLYKSREGLRYILKTTPDLHKIQQVDELLKGILLQVTGLLGAVDSFLAVIPVIEPGGDQSEQENYLVLLEDEKELHVHASTNQSCQSPNLDTEHAELVQKAISTQTIQVSEKLTIVPLNVGVQSIGVIYLDRPAVESADLEILQLFANQAAVAIHNAQLFEMATVDSLTGVYGRGFLERCLEREIKSAFRSQAPLSVIMVDMDGLKPINDKLGHLVGDRAIAAVGRVLKTACRTCDIIGRFGGDEFSIVLPQADLENARTLAQRIGELMREEQVGEGEGVVSLSCSVGICCLRPNLLSTTQSPSNAYYQTMATTLLKKADASLYRAKQDGRDRFDQGDAIEWKNLGNL